MTKRTAEQLYEDLCGTCLERMTDEELNDVELCEQVGELMFECQTCNWWCDESERDETEDGEAICINCKEDKT